MNLTKKKMKRSPDKRHLEEHMESELRCFDTHRSVFQS